ncbi:ImmA/IrrE family metallo-endopeptidase [Rothia nasimurium]|uniref:ImmA/IrrE family metallo-endopeptidase n=1 Tax=Rothia nasimurium TaxID=85336 RepID=A0A4Y9F436_9MICC|nr:ImmA/IrrE family metallo-endopeptidase [Rothia nasimurium]MBF0808372.1 ImmA/IrrE family metallo-endopeptidase [Rothia nasimurium]TFU22190.1 ImmA/IrrE family metallo-endopeptidase [Rothia nasimurium]
MSQPKQLHAGDKQLVYQAARQEAAKALEAFGDALTFPVDLRVVSELMYAQKQLDSQLDDISGMILKEPGQPAQILLNAQDSPERQRFTWAHELGHLAERTTLAQDFDYSFVDLRKPGSYSIHEFYADEFAGALLMPAAKISQLQEEGKSLVEMARFFGVSLSALNTRLHRLTVNPE